MIKKPILFGNYLQGIQADWKYNDSLWTVLITYGKLKWYNIKADMHLHAIFLTAGHSICIYMEICLE